MSNALEALSHSRKGRPVAPLTVFLAVIMTFFCAILIFVFVVTKQINPVMLDQQGRRLDRPAQKSTP